MKYKFFINIINMLPFYKEDIIEGKDYYIPTIDFEILDEKYEILDGLSGLSGDEIREIVKEFEEVKSGKLTDFRFGPESVVVMIMGENYDVEEYKNKCMIYSEYSDIELEISFSEIEQLMKDYLFEIEKWEKKTGKKKPGW